MNLPGYPLGRRGSPGGIEATRRVKAWAREVLAVEPDTVVTVTELACSEAGCAPVETVIVLLPPGERARRASIHKALPDVTRDDVAACAGRSFVML